MQPLLEEPIERPAVGALERTLQVALGGLLVWLSLDDQPDFDDLLAELEDDEDVDDFDDFDEPQPVEPLPSPEPPPDPAADDRPIACDGELPERAGETKPVHASPEPTIAPGVAYEAVIETSCGTVRIDLDSEGAPEGANARTSNASRIRAAWWLDHCARLRTR